MARQDRKTVYPTIRVSFRKSRTVSFTRSKVTQEIVLELINTLSVTMKSSAMEFRNTKKIDAAPFGVASYFFVLS